MHIVDKGGRPKTVQVDPKRIATVERLPGGYLALDGGARVR